MFEVARVTSQPPAQPPAHLRPETRAQQTTGLVVVSVLFGVVVGTCFVYAVPLGLMASAATLVLVGQFVSDTRRHTNRVIRANDEAVALIHGGRMIAASERLEAQARLVRHVPMVHAILVCNRAVAAMAMGDFSGALVLLESVREGRWLNNPDLPLRENLALAFMQAHLLQGDLSQARTWAAAARETLAPAREGMMVLPEVALACAEGRWADAMAHARQGRASAEAVLPAAHLRTLGVLEAFAWAHTPEGAANPEGIAFLVRSNAPRQPWELFAFRKAWPGFDAFCRAWALQAPVEQP